MVYKLHQLLPLSGTHLCGIQMGYWEKFVLLWIPVWKLELHFQMEPWNKAPEKVLCSRVSFAVNIKTPSQQTTCRIAAFVAASKFYFLKAGKTVKKKKIWKKKSPCKSRDQPLLRHSTKLATSTPLVLSLCPKSTYSGKSRAYITPNWALDIGRMGLLGHCFNWAFLGEFSGLLFKKENIEDRNKVAVVGCRQQEFGWIQEGVKMICRPFLLSDHLKCEWLHW